MILHVFFALIVKV